MTFRVGQKVVCVDASNDWPSSINSFFPLAEGAIYIVRAVGPTFRGAGGIKLAGIEFNSVGSFVGRHCGTPFRDAFLRSARFRPIVERKTDISVFTEILRKATQPARTPAMSLHHRGIEQ